MDFCGTYGVLSSYAGLGFGNRWFKPAYDSAQPLTLPSGKGIRLLTAPYLIATKLEAFDLRGGGDYLMSRDMEDVVAVLNGRPELSTEISHSDERLRSYLKRRFSFLLKDRNFLDAIPEHLYPDEDVLARFSILVDRIKEMVHDLK